eukprot:1158715-Pelagomonas_calceolata.AAC.9
MNTLSSKFKAGKDHCLMSDVCDRQLEKGGGQDSHVVWALAPSMLEMRSSETAGEDRAALWSMLLYFIIHFVFVSKSICLVQGLQAAVVLPECMQSLSFLPCWQANAVLDKPCAASDTPELVLLASCCAARHPIICFISKQMRCLSSHV